MDAGTTVGDGADLEVLLGLEVSDVGSILLREDITGADDGGGGELLKDSHLGLGLLAEKPGGGVDVGAYHGDVHEAQHSHLLAPTGQHTGPLDVDCLHREPRLTVLVDSGLLPCTYTVDDVINLLDDALDDKLLIDLVVSLEVLADGTITKVPKDTTGGQGTSTETEGDNVGVVMVAALGVDVLA